VPIIFLYGLFFLADFFANGFFAFLYSAILFISGFMIFSARFSGIKISSLLHLDLISFFALTLSAVYVMTILLLVTNFFAV